MSAISSFYKFIRLVVGDHDPYIKLISDEQLQTAVQLVVNSGEVPGYAMDDEDTITPDIVPADDPDSFARIVYKSSKMFALQQTSFATATRAYRETVGESKALVFDILSRVYDLDNGDQLS